MSIELRRPQFSGTDRDKLQQMHSYLYQLVDQLQYAFETVEPKSGETTVIKQTFTQTSGENRPATPEDAEATFAAIKNLIIKSGDIVDAYYEDINQRLEESKIYVLTDSYNVDKVNIDDAIGKNNAEFLAHQEFADNELAHSKEVGAANAEAIKNNADSFNVFREQTMADIKANANNISIEHQKIEALQSVFQDDANAAYVRKSTGYIKTGFLSGDEYGVEVGQTKDGQDIGSARFTPGRIAFYEDLAYADSNAKPSAWLSNRRLHATEVEAVERQQIGGFVDIVDKETGDVTTRWAVKEEE